MQLLREDDDRFAIHRHGGFDATSPGQQTCIKGLYAMGVESFTALTGEQRRHRWWNFGIGPGCAHFKSHALAGSDGVDGDLAAPWNRLSGDEKHVEKQFYAVLG